MKRFIGAGMFLVFYLVTASGVSEKLVYRIVVRFGSVCCGIDREVYDKVMRLIADREQQIGKTIAVEKVYWGKEGEFNLCMALDELPEARRFVFVHKVKDITDNVPTVKVDENSPCTASWE